MRRLVASLTFLFVFILFSRPPSDTDLWWHLRSGQVMWTQKSILLADMFSYTRFDTPWVNAFWLSDIFFYFCYCIGTYIAIAVLVSFTGALTFHLIYRRLSGNALLNGFIVTLAAITAAPIWGPRPQIFSFLLIAWLDMRLVKKQADWILPLVFALWANIHGGWFWGFLLILAHLAGRLADHFQGADEEEKKAIRTEILHNSGWTLLSMLAVGINPNGLAIWKLPFQQVDVSLRIQEWLSPDFHTAGFHPMLWMIFLLLFAAPLAGKPNWPQLFKVLGFAYLTFVSQRTVALFAIVTTPLLAEWLGTAILKIVKIERPIPNPTLSPRWTRIVNTLLISLLIVCAGINLYQVSRPARVEMQYPTEAVKWIQNHAPQGRMFNSYNWGGYLLWTLPNQPVFIDGRADLYGSELIQQWQDVVNARQNAQSVLDAWDIQWIFVEPDWPIVTLLKQADWRIIYEDDRAEILQRP